MDYHVNLDAAWRDGGPNELAVLVHNTAGAGGLLGKITLEGGLGGGTEIHGWRMRGGETPPAADAPAWRPLGGERDPGVPAWYRAEFRRRRRARSARTRSCAWRSRRCRAGSSTSTATTWADTRRNRPIDGIYLQECWLHPGKNTLMIFDEDGNSPSQVKIFVETAASRRGVVLAARLPRPTRTAER